MEKINDVLFSNFDNKHKISCAPPQDCIICMDQLSNPSSYETPSTEEGGQSIQPETVGKFIKCGHTLHMLCMLAMYNNGTKVTELLWTTWQLGFIFLYHVDRLLVVTFWCFAIVPTGWSEESSLKYRMTLTLVWQIMPSVSECLSVVWHFGK